MSGRRIVGIVFVRNEDIFVEQAVRNIADFCDELILADHGSRDRTPGILRKLADELPHTACHFLKSAPASHDLIRKFAGTDTWIFAVDGDELYEPQKLAALRERILGGEFSDYWLVLGNVLHASKLSPDRSMARGYSSPPSRSMTKLYNFAAIESWDDYAVERLHGSSPVFRDGYGPDNKLRIFSQYSWDDSPFRCLHVCFCRRSSMERGRSYSRQSFVEKRTQGLTARMFGVLVRLIGLEQRSRLKLRNYSRGTISTVESGTFFDREGDQITPLAPATPAESGR